MIDLKDAYLHIPLHKDTPMLSSLSLQRLGLSVQSIDIQPVYTIPGIMVTGAVLVFLRKIGYLSLYTLANGWW